MGSVIGGRSRVPEVVLIEGVGPARVVALVAAQEGSEGCRIAVCWWNDRLIHGIELFYLRCWAARSVAVGHRFRVMRLEELLAFRAEGARGD